MNTIWEVPKQRHPWRTMVKDRLLSLSMVFVLGFFMVVSLTVSVFVTGLTDWWGNVYSKTGLELANTIISCAIISGLFAVVFKMLPDTRLEWKDVFPGAVASAIFFIAGKFVLGWYIAHSAFASSYGAAASFVVILFWVFYSAQILYFGAELTRSYTLICGSRHKSA